MGDGGCDGSGGVGAGDGTEITVRPVSRLKSHASSRRSSLARSASPRRMSGVPQARRPVLGGVTWASEPEQIS